MITIHCAPISLNTDTAIWEGIDMFMLGLEREPRNSRSDYRGGAAPARPRARGRTAP